MMAVAGQYLLLFNSATDILRYLNKLHFQAPIIQFLWVALIVNYSLTAFIQLGSLQQMLFFRCALVISSIGRTKLTVFTDLINFRVEQINAEDVITFCLFLMNKVESHLDKVTPIFRWMMSQFIYPSDVHANSYPHRGTRWGEGVDRTPPRSF